MSDRMAVRVAWMMFGVITLSLAGGLTLSLLAATGPELSGRPGIATSWLFWLAMFAFPAVGILIATRQPRNAIGWILLAIGLVWELGDAFMLSYARYGLVAAPGAVPRPELAMVLTSSVWVPAVGLIGTFLLLLFPDGRLPSPRWRPFAWFAGLTLVGLPIVMTLLPAPLRDFATDGDLAAHLTNTVNPLGLDALRPALRWIYPLVLVVPICIAGSALSLVARFRRARGQERLQLKWLAAAAAICATVYGTMMVLSLFFGGELWDNPVDPLWLTVLQRFSIFAFLLVPVAIGIAILRHRLFEIDVLIRRTLVYGVLTVALALVYVVGVVTLSTITGVMTGRANNDLAVAASTLTVAGLFGTLRRRIQSFIDRRFYRRRYDVQQTLAAFSARLRDRLDPPSVGTELVDLVATTVRPAGVWLWLRSAPLPDRLQDPAPAAGDTDRVGFR